MKKSILFGIIIVFLLATAFIVRGKPPTADKFQPILDKIAVLEGKIDQLTQCSCACTDNDEDGYGDGTGGNITCPEGTELDCDDSNPDIYPGAEEVCDGLDNDCDGEVDEGCPVDADNDGYASDVDCNDNDASINPGAEEVCDGLDNDCDGQVDGFTESCPLNVGVCVGATQTCTSGNWSECYYGSSYEADETTCDNLDNDCDGEVDEGGVCPTACTDDNDCNEAEYCDDYVCYSDLPDGSSCTRDNECLSGICSGATCGSVDADNDGYTSDVDCNDNDASINPGAIEVCDGLDNNCEGGVDEGLTQSCPLQEGVCLGAIQTCTSGVWPDCDYGDNYEADEITCDGLDNDCDGVVDEGC